MKTDNISYENSILEHVADKLIAERFNAQRSTSGHAPDGPGGAGAGANFSKYAVVFPGKRPALYLRRIIADKLNSPYYPPKLFSIDEFIKYIAEKDGRRRNEIDSLNASWLIYDILKNIYKGRADAGEAFPAAGSIKDLKFIKETDKFEDFFSWGLLIFNAINELDAGLVDNDKIKNIKSFYSAYVPETINRFYNYFSEVRDEFHKKLREENLTASGLNYIDAVNFLNNNAGAASGSTAEKFKEFEKIYFTDLFLPSRGENFIINTLAGSGIAEVFFWSEPEIHAYSTVFHFYEGQDTHSELLACGKIFNISLAACPEISSSACPEDVFGNESGGGIPPEKTAVILPDAGTLMPFLYHAMNHIDSDYNITMGYPLKRTPFYSLIRLIFKAQESSTLSISPPAHSEEISSNSQEAYLTMRPMYRAKDYLNLIKHPYVKTLGGIDTVFSINGIEKNIVRNGEPFIWLKDIENIENISPVINKIHKYFFARFEDDKMTVKDFTNGLSEIIGLIAKENAAVLNYQFSSEFVKKIIEAVNTFSGSYFKDELQGKKSVFRLFKYYLDNESAAFNGIPLKGMQIMGILETRALKFDRVVIFDANEDILPPVKKLDPVLPDLIRKKLGLFTYGDYESIYRYYFRRLVYGSKEAHIIYIKNNKRIRSRFVEEIIWDNEKKAKNFDIENEIKPLGFKTEISLNRESGSGLSFRIDKTDEILKIINEITVDKLSASVIDTYVNCPAQFYYKYIVKLEEAKFIKEGIGAAQTGMLVHSVLKRFYEEIRRNGEDIERCLEDEDFLYSKIDKAVEDKGGIEGLEIDIHSGEYFMVKETAKRILYNFVKNDLKNSQSNEFKWEILELESAIESDFEISRKIKLYGKIDRIDIYKNKNNKMENILIIDYKTGVSPVIPDIKKIFVYGEGEGEGKLSPVKSRSKIKELIKSFQLPIYLYLLKNKLNLKDYNNMNACLNLTGAGKKTAPGDYGNRSYLQGIMAMKSDNNSKADTQADMEKIMEGIFIPSLKYIIEEILNKETPFAADGSDKKICEYCPYSLLCDKI